jgi:hypothetical protein
VQIRVMPTIPAELKPAVSKYIAPEALFWFRWAALATWVMGMILAFNRGHSYAVEAITLGLAGGYDPAGLGLEESNAWMARDPEAFREAVQDSLRRHAAAVNRLVERGQLASYHHRGFWQSMDTLRDKAVLDAAYAKGAPWLKG